MEEVYWLVAFALLILIEIVTLGLTTIWFAGGAIAAFIASLMGASLIVQLVLFAVISFVLLFFTRPLAIRYFNKQRSVTNTDSLIGQEAKVIEEIDNSNQIGQVTVNGQEWSARSEDDRRIITGKQVVIKKIVGVKLIVKEKEEQKAEL